MSLRELAMEYYICLQHHCPNEIPREVRMSSRQTAMMYHRLAEPLLSNWSSEERVEANVWRTWL